MRTWLEPMKQSWKKINSLEQFSEVIKNNRTINKLIWAKRHNKITDEEELGILRWIDPKFNIICIELDYNKMDDKLEIQIPIDMFLDNYYLSIEDLLDE